MDLKSLGRTVAKFAPMLGKLIPIPGVGVGIDLLAAAFGVEPEPNVVAQAIAADPDAGVKIAQIEATHKEAIQRQLLEAETSRISSVNETMRSEAKSEHWAQWLWRPYNGFLFGTTLFMVYALPTIINSFAPILIDQTVITTIVEGVSTIANNKWVPITVGGVPEFVFVAWGSILGVSAWHRGNMQTKVASVFGRNKE